MVVKTVTSLALSLPHIHSHTGSR